MILYFKDIRIGQIDDSCQDGMCWQVGTINLSDAAIEFREFFDFLIDEEPEEGQENSFPKEWIEVHNWRIVSGEDVFPNVSFAIYDDGEIYWRSD